MWLSMDLRGGALGLAFAAALTMSGLARADELDFAPSVAVAQSYDDNLFLTSTDPRGSFFWRIEPGMQVALRTPTLVLDADYTFDSEIYPAPYAGLSDALERQGADLHARWQLDAELSWHASGVFRESDDSRDLAFALDNGIDLGRREGFVVDVGTGLDEKLTRRLDFTIDYRYLREEDDGIGSTDTHSEEMVLTWREDRQVSFGVGVLVRENLLDSGWDNDAVPSLRLSVALSPSLSMRLAAGPRLGMGGYQTMEGLAGATWKMRPFALEASASRAETTLPGVPTPLDTDLAQIKGSVSFGKTVVYLGPAYYRSTAPTLDAEAFQIDSGLDTPLANWLALFATYRFTWQDVNGTGADAAHDQLFLLGVTARVPDESLRRPL